MKVSVLDAEVLQESLHRYVAIHRRDAIRPSLRWSSGGRPVVLIQRCMKPNMKRLLVNAAMAGMIAGVGAMTPAVSTAADTNPGVSQNSCGGNAAENAENTDRHACKAMNACKGKGGCAVPVHQDEDN